MTAATLSVHCPAPGCGRKLAEVEYPVQALRLRCRRCGARISLRWLDFSKVELDVEKAVATCTSEA